MSAFTRGIIVRFEHCDPAGLIFYPRFFALVNEMVEDWFAGPLECSFKALHIGQRKGVPTLKLDAEFLLPARIGDTLAQSLIVAHLGASSCRLRHEARIASEIVARFDHTIVYVDLDAMRPEPWPPALRAAMARFNEEHP